MAGGPYKDRYGNYYITWSNKKLNPSQPKINESLKAKKKPEANKRKFRLEELYEKGKHNPWECKWYDNPTLKPFITDSLTSGNLNSITSNHFRISLEEASQEYIAYQINRPKGWQSELTQEVYTAEIEKYVSLIGFDRYISSITEEDLNKVVFRDTVQSYETMKSDRSKLIAMFNYFKKRRWLDEVPDIEVPEPQKKVPKFFYDEQFLSVCWYKICKVEKAMKSGAIKEGGPHQLRFVLAWQLIAGTGMRPREACSLRLSDVYGNNLLVGSKYKGKTNSQRMVPLMYEAIQAVDLLTDKSYRAKDPALANTDLLLGIQSDMVRKRLSKELKEAYEQCYPGRGKRTLYNLRDYYAVRFLSDKKIDNQDFRLIQLKNHLGHGNITMTEKYLKALPGRLDLSMKKSVDVVKILSKISSKVMF